MPSLGFSWKSQPLNTSKSDFAIIGEEVDGRSTTADPGVPEQWLKQVPRLFPGRSWTGGGQQWDVLKDDNSSAGRVEGDVPAARMGHFSKCARSGAPPGFPNSFVSAFKGKARAVLSPADVGHPSVRIMRKVAWTGFSAGRFIYGLITIDP